LCRPWPWLAAGGAAGAASLLTRAAPRSRRFLRQRVGREKQGVFCELDAEVGAALTRRLLARVMSQRQQRSASLPRSD